MNQGQKVLNIRLEMFLNNNKNYFLVTGAAGSGKTTTVSNFFLEQKIYKIQDVIILTPTHKAKFVIKKKTNNKFECMTIHKFLGYGRKIDEDGNIKFIMRDNPDVKDVKVIIVDECSMINMYCYMKMREKIEKSKLKAIFMGDENQLPPINEILSDTFDIDNNINLNESIRNSGNIYNICDTMLKNMNNKNLKIWKNVEDDVNMFNNRVDYVDDLLENKDKDYKILCWTNAKCDTMNKVMRDKIYGRKCDRFCVGERLIVKNYFMDMKLNVYSSNEELIVRTVERVELHTKDFNFVPAKYIKDIEGGIKAYRLTLEERGDNVIYVVKTKHERVIIGILNNIKNDAKKAKRNNDYKNAKMLWEMYYNVREIFMPPIDYSYAITVHRSQGSEWDIVYVELKDIMRNRKTLERNKLIYVAFSRAMKRLVINVG